VSSKILTVGNLRPEDDFMHTVSEHPSHNESMFFNFFDADQQLGGFVRIGNRPNEGHAEMTFCVFLPNGELLMQWGKPAIDSNEVFNAAGLKFRVVEPGVRLAVSYDAGAVLIADPLQMKDPGKAMRGNPTVPTRLELSVSGVGPMIGDRDGSSPDAVIFLAGVGHYQQAIAASGELVAGERRWQIHGRGVRDHSWGKRLWHSLRCDRSLWISFGDDLTLIACKTWLTGDEHADEMGCIIENGVVTPLRTITMHTHFAPDSYYHDRVDLEAVDAQGRRFEIKGEVLTYVPLRHRKPGQETVYLGQAMTRFRYGDRVTVGLSEYFDAESETERLIACSRRDETITE